MLRVSNTKQEYGSWTAITRNMHLVLNVAIDFHPGVGLVVVVGVVLRSHQWVLGLGHQGKSCKDSDSKQTKGTKDGDSKHYAPQMTAITFSVPAISQPLDGDWLELWLLWMQTLFWCCGQHWRIIYVNFVSFSSVNVHKMRHNERRIGQRNTC